MKASAKWVDYRDGTEGMLINPDHFEEGGDLNRAIMHELSHSGGTKDYFATFGEYSYDYEGLLDDYTDDHFYNSLAITIYWKTLKNFGFKCCPKDIGGKWAIILGQKMYF